MARRQLAAIGLSETMVRERMRDGQLVPLHRGVYAVGHRHLRREGYWLAAVLAAGPEAVLSHASAAELYGIRPSAASKIDVTTTKRRASTDRIRIHRTRTLDDDDVTTQDGIPVTTPARTLVDLASVLQPPALLKVLNEAEHQRLFDLTAIERATRRTARRRGQGHAALTQALHELADHGPTLTRSSLEDAFLDLTKRAGLPRPATNAYVEGHEVDACWRDHRLIVELDGWARHRTKQAFQKDRTKANDLTKKGYTVLRFTYDDVIRDPGYVTGSLNALLP